MTRQKLLSGAVALAMVVLLVLSVILAMKARPKRRVSMTEPVAERREVRGDSLANQPLDRWTARLVELEAAASWPKLDDELAEVRREKPAQYQKFALGYLHARVLIELEKWDAAEEALKPFLAGHDLTELARMRQIEIQEGRGAAGEAARLRAAFIRDYPDSRWREEAIESHLDYLQEEAPTSLIAFAAALRSSADTALRRELDARAATALARLDRREEAVAKAVSVLRGGTADDPSETALGVLEDLDAVETLSSRDLLLAGETARDHRHYERAVEILSLARGQVRGRDADILFAIGRSHFGNEKFADAEEVYLQGSGVARTGAEISTFHFHAARAAQLAGEDDRAVRHMTRAIAVKGNYDSTSAALTQRMRTKMKQGDLRGGLADLRQLERLFPRGRGRVEAAIQAATYLLAANRRTDALRELDRIPRSLVRTEDRPEIDYWKARALEATDPARALELHLGVLRAPYPSHFAFFSRERIETPPLAAARAAALASERATVDRAVAAKEWRDALEAQTAVVLLSPREDEPLRVLRGIYENVEEFREVLELTPAPLPSLDGDDIDRGELLMALGLFDDAEPEIEARWGLRPMRDALTRAHALNLAGASRDSIYAIEVMMRSVPEGFVPELLPRRVQELLYPRYFHSAIERDSARHGADPRLVLSIMREESRFNPRAKSAAAARGLLQFIITTARSIGRGLGLVELDSSDLYDPATIIALGAAYVADLLDQFEDNRYRTAAAYNAGPAQTRLWARLQPAEGNDYFLASVNFSETKHYIRKVMNSYHRYGEIYEGEKVEGGLRAEP